jgi:S-adenosylmethionine synthetase
VRLGPDLTPAQKGDLRVPSGNSLSLFTSESVSMGHPDKVADQISDTILDSLLEHDPNARSAIEVLVTTGLTVVAGEVKVGEPAAREALYNVEQTVRDAIQAIGYDDPTSGFDYRSCAVLRALHAQSEDISRGVTPGEGPRREQGAGDQGLMFGYACDETDVLMPLPIHLAHRIVEHQALLRERGEIPWLRPDAKSQVTVAYDERRPVAIHTIVLSTQHTEEVCDSRSRNITPQAQAQLREQLIQPMLEKHCPELSTDATIYHINPTGRFVTGGPHGDTGLTGRKIIVDTYGGRGRHGGGAFSGKDASKVDRSASYMARHVAKNIVAAGLATECEVQLAYAIGIADPVSISVNTFGTSELPGGVLEQVVREVFPLTPRGIIDDLELRRPIFRHTARHGHFGRTGDDFTWERTHRVADLLEAVKSAQAAV